jgi:hypothetical protein
VCEIGGFCCFHSKRVLFEILTRFCRCETILSQIIKNMYSLARLDKMDPREEIRFHEKNVSG